MNEWDILPEQKKELWQKATKAFSSPTKTSNQQFIELLFIDNWGKEAISDSQITAIFDIRLAWDLI